MLDLFRLEVESQAQVLTGGLLALERQPDLADQLEACMRAAHSLKGAARIVDLTACVDIAHVMEDGFVAAQRGTIRLGARHIDLLLRGVDLLTTIATTAEADLPRWSGDRRAEVTTYVDALGQALSQGDDAATPTADATTLTAPAPTAPAPVVAAPPDAEPATTGGAAADRVLRVTADNLNRLLALAGESLVESRWLKPFAESLLRLKRLHHELAQALDRMRESIPADALDDAGATAQAEAHRRIHECQQMLGQRLAELENYDRRSASLSHRLYDEALACRMRPFRDGLHGLPRMVRDLARSLGKEARLVLVGPGTPVDRDILDKLEAPLTHLLRNAVDHGLEVPGERAAAGKPPEGTVTLEARHSGGMLQIIVSDDGRGIDAERVRAAVLSRGLANAQTAAQLTEGELLEFLFLPGFTMKQTVSEISGRGVGLDAVQDTVRKVRGSVRISTQAGLGTRFHLQLPLTLSVARTLIVDIGGEPYAFPLAYIVRTLRLPKDGIELLEGRQHFRFDGRHLGLVSAHQVLGRGESQAPGGMVSVVVIGDAQRTYGLVVDRFIGERELVVQPLDPRLGKVKDIAAGALLPDGEPVLIVDVEDLIRSVEKLVSVGRLDRVQQFDVQQRKRKRVLVVDDSLTVRELERKLLDGRGYDVEVAVDGMDGWNAVRTGHFDLVVTDIDMPRLDGLELVRLVKKDPTLRALPVMIVSYKDREEDRRRGLEAGADYYLAKGSFHDETLLQAVVDLVGEA